MTIFHGESTELVKAQKCPQCGKKYFWHTGGDCPDCVEAWAKVQEARMDNMNSVESSGALSEMAMHKVRENLKAEAELNDGKISINSANMKKLEGLLAQYQKDGVPPSLGC